jgi:hypothetical protein
VAADSAAHLDEAFQSRTNNFAAGYQDYETGEVVRFQLDVLELTEEELPLSRLAPSALDELDRFRVAWAATAVSFRRWSGYIEMCGTLTREAVVVRRSEGEQNFTWVLYPPGGEGDHHTDHTFGPMW